MVGNGDQKKQVEEYAKQKKIKNILFIGNVNNVQDYLQLMDLFLMPSLYEGFGIAAIESQACGLPTICSNNVPHEIDLTNLARHLSITNGLEIWKNEINKFRNQNIAREKYENVLEKNGFDIRSTYKELERMYGLFDEKK